VKEVDSVLATHELVDLMKLKGINFNELPEYSVESNDLMMGSPSGWGFFEMMQEIV
jgi:iron only hydrogenase large subunit-like protein